MSDDQVPPIPDQAIQPIPDPPLKRKPRAKRFRNCVQFLLNDEQYLQLLEHSKPTDLSAYVRDLVVDDMGGPMALMARVRTQAEKLSDEQRLELLEILMSGCCRHCGRVVREDERSCQCWNDE